MQTLGELRLFLLGETLTKQQQMILGILEQQNEGVVLLQPPKAYPKVALKESNYKKPKSDVLYVNNALKRIFREEEATSAIAQSRLLVKHEE